MIFGRTDKCIQDSLCVNEGDYFYRLLAVKTFYNLGERWNLSNSEKVTPNLNLDYLKYTEKRDMRCAADHDMQILNNLVYHNSQWQKLRYPLI